MLFLEGLRVDNPDELYKQIGMLVRKSRKEEELSQEQLGERIRLTRTSINNIERGRQRVQIHTLFDIAETLGVLPSELLPPARDPDKPKSRSPKGLQNVPKEIRSWVSEMAAVNTQPQLQLGLMKDLQLLRKRVAQRKLDKAAQISFVVSELLDGLPREPPVPVEHLARNMGVTLRHSPCQAAVTSFILQRDRVIIIGVNSAQATTRQRFAIAHSLGHLLLQKKAEEFRLDIDFNLTSDPEEDIANRFALKLLVPEPWLQRDLESETPDFESAEKVISNLAKRYKVSRQVMASCTLNRFIT